MSLRVERARWDTTPAGEPVHVFTLANSHGIEVRFAEYGGIVLSIRAPDAKGASGIITHGYATLGDYLRDGRYAGALIGRYANRIAGARFTVDGRESRLSVNERGNHLHGGRGGFHTVVWRGEVQRSSSSVGAVLRYTSLDGEQGYPGRLDVRAEYTLTDDNELFVAFGATTDKPTPISLTQHSYFNLSAGERDILGHELTLDASRFTPVNAELIPTGELRDVAGTALDFRRPAAVGARIASDEEQMRLGGGYDHNFVLDHPGDDAKQAARLRDPVSGRVLEIRTTAPALQFYSGNGNGSAAPWPGWRRHGALALEPQRFPDAPNQPAFPAAILRPGEEYAERIVYRFGVDGGR